MTRITRRQLLAAAVAPVGGIGIAGTFSTSRRSQPRDAASRYSLPSDDELLDDLSRRSWQFFWEHGNTPTGQVRDRARADGSPHEPRQRNVASIAATGFGLAALSIAAERGWISREDGAARVRTTLRFLAEGMPQQRGWFYHFVDTDTGARAWQCELSSIDTALLLAGVLTARQAFAADQTIVRTAITIYERVDFPWMLNGHPHLLSMGWKPESGFLDARWQHYCELMILYLLAIASPTHPLPAAAWYAWERPEMRFDGYRYISHADPLFVHQFSHAWVDFRGRREARPPQIDWWQNSVTATRAHKAFCLSLAREFPGYEEDVWGITASDSAKGYVAWGGPPRHPAIDGTVVPCAAAGSLMLAPDITIPVVRTLAKGWGGRVFGRYGFVDAFSSDQRLDESRRDRDRCRHHAPQRREPAQRSRVPMVHGQPGDCEGHDGCRSRRVGAEAG